MQTLSEFRRRLTVRLAVVGTLAALIAGLAAYFIETERLEATLVDRAALQAGNLGPAVPRMAAKEEIDAALAGFLAVQAAANRDFFVIAELYDAGTNPVGEATLPDFGHVEEGFDRGGHRFPPQGATWYRKTVIGGAPYLQVMVPLAGATGWFEGIYRLSPETLKGIRDDIAQIVGLVMAAVLLTALALHPLMVSLQGRVMAAARNLLHANIDTLKVLGSAIAKRDSDTNAHNFRVTVYATRIAEALGLDRAAMRSLIKGAFLHDVGKIAIPDAVLLKPGKLDADEFTVMKAHVVHGLDIIGAGTWLCDAAEVVGGHHEKVDGTGYPRGLAGDEVPLAARIFAVADVFDALTSQRPYKKAMDTATALAILEEGRGRHFDGAVLDAFRGILSDAAADLSKLSAAEAEALADTVIARYFTI
jgi:HD-GYP domain-containing protein (c-di-GMP phosphodiesterase class II)